MKLYTRLLQSRNTNAKDLCILLHGLYGSSDNLLSLAKALQTDNHVLLIDLPNHGRSPHSDSHTYESICKDIWDSVSDIEAISVYNKHLIGHSMGGKVAMHLLKQEPDYFSSSIIMDIAPVNYSCYPHFANQIENHKRIADVLLHTPLKDFATRTELSTYWQTQLGDKLLSDFMLKNITLDTNSRLAWKINLPTLHACLNQILDGIPASFYRFPTDKPAVLFLKGETSLYISDDVLQDLYRAFPKAIIQTVPNANHYIHIQNPEGTYNAIKEFIKRIE